MDFCINYIQHYIGWLKNAFKIEDCNNSYCHIITPFLRQDNDNIEIFIEKSNEHLLFTDDGTTFEYLFLRGVDLDTPTRQQYINSISLRTGVIFNGYEIQMQGITEKDLGQRFNDFINAIISINNLVYTVSERDKTTFRDDVRNFLYTKNIAYTNMSIVGYSKEYKFDIVVLRRRPIILEPISAASSSYAMNLAQKIAFQWNDIRKNNFEFKGVSLINDKEDVWDADIMSILQNYSDETVSWSERDKLVDILAA